MRNDQMRRAGWYPYLGGLAKPCAAGVLAGGIFGVGYFFGAMQGAEFSMKGVSQCAEQKEQARIYPDGRLSQPLGTLNHRWPLIKSGPLCHQI